MRRLVATILRRLGTLGHVLSRLLDRGVPTDAPRAQSALLIGAAQILWMDVPDHAAVDLSVRLVQADRRAAKYAGLVNAVLRRCAREGEALIAEVASNMVDLPPWLVTRWIAAYGEERAKAMATAISFEPPLDLTVKSEPESWAVRLHGEALATGTVRTPLQGSVTCCPASATGNGGCRICRRRAAGAAVRRPQWKGRSRSVRRARRKNGTARAGRRLRHRDRPAPRPASHD